MSEMKKAYGGVLSEMSPDEVRARADTGGYEVLRLMATVIDSVGIKDLSVADVKAAWWTTGGGGLKSDSLDSLLFLAEQSAGGCFDPIRVED